MLDGLAVRFTMSEAFVYIPNDRRAFPGIRGPVGRGWRHADLLDVMNNASVMGEAEFAAIFPEVPMLPEIVHCDKIEPLPDDSWCSDPIR
jgi:hypothetical protein